MNRNMDLTSFLQSTPGPESSSDVTMSPAKTKKCAKCGVGFRGTMAPEEVCCAKCYVKNCEVPEDIDDQFFKLVSEYHGPELAGLSSSSASSSEVPGVLPMMKDMLDHKARLKKVEQQVEKSTMSNKQKNRMNRDVNRLREEKKEMEAMIEKLQAKMMHLAMTLPSVPKTKQSYPEKPAQSSAPLVPPRKGSATATGSKSPVAIAPTTTQQRSPLETERKMDEELMPPPAAIPPPKPKQSPVKLAAAKFEKAAKKVNTVVTFADLPTKSKKKQSSAPPPEKKLEVNNNDTPVTASSSSEEEGEPSEHPSTLTRSNSVRDRIKAFEDIQRRASTGSYDRKKAQAEKRVGRRSLTSMKSIIV